MSDKIVLHRRLEPGGTLETVRFPNPEGALKGQAVGMDPMYAVGQSEEEEGGRSGTAAEDEPHL